MRKDEEVKVNALMEAKANEGRKLNEVKSAMKRK